MFASFDGSRENDSFTFQSPKPVSSVDPEPEQIDLIICMAKHSAMESHLEASRILCDLTMDEVMLPYLCKNGCVEALRGIIASSRSDWAKQHAMVALANISDTDLGKVC